jgi:hypothetical protein
MKVPNKEIKSPQLSSEHSHTLVLILSTPTVTDTQRQLKFQRTLGQQNPQKVSHDLTVLYSMMLSFTF